MHYCQNAVTGILTDNLHIIQQLDIKIVSDWSYSVLDISDNDAM